MEAAKEIECRFTNEELISIERNIRVNYLGAYLLLGEAEGGQERQVPRHSTPKRHAEAKTL